MAAAAEMSVVLITSHNIWGWYLTTRGLFSRLTTTTVSRSKDLMGGEHVDKHVTNMFQNVDKAYDYGSIM